MDDQKMEVPTENKNCANCKLPLEQQSLGHALCDPCLAANSFPDTREHALTETETETESGNGQVDNMEVSDSTPDVDVAADNDVDMTEEFEANAGEPDMPLSSQPMPEAEQPVEAQAVPEVINIDVTAAWPDWPIIVSIMNMYENRFELLRFLHMLHSAVLHSMPVTTSAEFMWSIENYDIILSLSQSHISDFLDMTECAIQMIIQK